MNKVIFYVCLIFVFMLSCSDDAPTLYNTRWEYTESGGDEIKTHTLTFTAHNVWYTISSGSTGELTPQANTYEFEGKYVYRHPDIKLELYGGRIELTCTGDQLVPKNREAGGMVFSRK